MTSREAQRARDLVRMCALETGDLPAPQAAQLTQALSLSDKVIHESVTARHTTG